MKRFDWAEYLDFARYLCEEDYEDEAALRSAISRAYYAAYNLAEKFRSDRNIPLSGKKGNLHDKLWATFGESSNSVWQAIATNGDNLREARNRVDYILIHKDHPKTIELWLKQANDTVRTVSNILFYLDQIKSHTND